MGYIHMIIKTQVEKNNGDIISVGFIVHEIAIFVWIPLLITLCLFPNLNHSKRAQYFWEMKIIFYWVQFIYIYIYIYIYIVSSD